MIAQKYYTGKHLTTDFVKYKGKVVDFYTFIGHKDKNGSFTLFEASDEVNLKALLIAQDIPLKNGFINIETIADGAIEAHLRPSLQLYDISGGLHDKYLQNPIVTGKRF